MKPRGGGGGGGCRERKTEGRNTESQRDSLKNRHPPPGLGLCPRHESRDGSLPPNRTVAWVLQYPRRDAVTLGLVSFVLTSQAAF